MPHARIPHQPRSASNNTNPPLAKKTTGVTKNNWGHIFTFDTWHTCFNSARPSWLRRNRRSYRRMAIDTAL